MGGPRWDVFVGNTVEGDDRFRELEKLRSSKGEHGDKAAEPEREINRTCPQGCIDSFSNYTSNPTDSPPAVNSHPQKPYFSPPNHHPSTAPSPD
jgi:hypothetical protein